MDERTKRKPYGFFGFLGAWIAKTWERAHKKFGGLADYVTILGTLGLLYFTWYKRSHPKADTSTSEAAVTYWLAVVPFGLWVIWMVYHFFKAPFEIYNELWRKAEDAEQLHYRSIEGLNKINSDHIGALNSMMHRIQSEADACRKQLDDREKRKEARIELTKYLAKIEERAKQINGMSPRYYIESIDDDPNKEKRPTITSMYDFEGHINKLEDKASLSIIKETAIYLDISVEEGKGRRFLSHTGLVLSPPDKSEGVLAPFFNKRMNMLENLEHWQKNLLEIIKELN